MTTVYVMVMPGQRGRLLPFAKNLDAPAGFTPLWATEDHEQPRAVAGILLFGDDRWSGSFEALDQAHLSDPAWSDALHAHWAYAGRAEPTPADEPGARPPSPDIGWEVAAAVGAAFIDGLGALAATLHLDGPKAPDSIIEDAREAGRRFAAGQRWAQLTGERVDTATLRTRLGVSRQAINQRVASGSLMAVPGARRGSRRGSSGPLRGRTASRCDP
jgi:hypothetical protein